VAPIFRHWLGALVAAVAVLAATALYLLLVPKHYQAQMTLLVKRERASTIVSAAPNVSAQTPTPVTEEELDSAVALLKSRDLLAKVVAAAGLAPASDGSVALERAVRRLDSELDVAPIRKTSLIKVSYTATDPTRAARVLERLGHLYLEKHLVVNRPAGAYEFFTAQSDRFRQELTAAREKLDAYGRAHDVVDANVERDNTLRQLADFETEREKTRAQIADTKQRRVQLRALIGKTSERITTVSHTAVNTQLIATLEQKVLELNLKRTDMLQKFNPSYPPVVDLETQLQEARAALTTAQGTPPVDHTSDVNPTYQWAQNELARVTTEQQAAVARAAAVEASIADYRDKARRLDAEGANQDVLKRSLQLAEQNYQLYLRKQEEARISEALDRTRIANVAIAEAPTVPVLSAGPGRLLVLLLGVGIAAMVGVFAAYLLDFLSPYCRTADEVEDALGIPVLAALPTQS
jgi:uncharacterized protein involved in exopolysaccharide biosynthesis